MQWTTGTNFATQHTMTNSSSKQQQRQQQQYYRAAGMGIRMHTRTSGQNVRYDNIILC